MFEEEMIRHFLIAIVGRAARERIHREGPWEYVGCRRDCITVSQSAISWIVAGYENLCAVDCR